MSEKTKWERTGECRIVPWHLGLMRAEFMERRDLPNEMYQIRWVRAGKLPFEYDNAGPFGFLSTVATTEDRKYGDRALWRRFISYWKAIPQFPIGGL